MARFLPALWRIYISFDGTRVWVAMGGPPAEGEHTVAYCVQGDTEIPYTITVEGEDSMRHWGNFSVIGPNEGEPGGRDPLWFGDAYQTPLPQPWVDALEKAGQEQWEAEFGAERPDWKPQGYVDGRLVPHGQD